MSKLKLTPEEYNRWIWHRAVQEIKTNYKFESMSTEELEEIFICVIKGMSNRQLVYYFDVGPYVASKMRDAVRETKLWQIYNRVFHKNNMLFSENGILGRRVKFWMQKI